MITDAYASEPEYRAAKNQESVADAMVNQSYLLAASRYLDQKLGRRMGFHRDDSPTARYYVPAARPSGSVDWAESENPWKYGPRARVLEIDDLVSVTEIALDTDRTGNYSRILSPGDYELLPLNATLGAEPRPYTQVAAAAGGQLVGWPSGVKVRITGVFGWPAVPEAIKIATIELAAILQLKSPFATGRVDDFDQTLGTSPQARAILLGLMTNYSRAVAF